MDPQIVDITAAPFRPGPQEAIEADPFGRREFRVAESGEEPIELRRIGVGVDHGRASIARRLWMQ